MREKKNNPITIEKRDNDRIREDLATSRKKYFIPYELSSKPEQGLKEVFGEVWAEQLRGKLVPEMTFDGRDLWIHTDLPSLKTYQPILEDTVAEAQKRYQQLLLAREEQKEADRINREEEEKERKRRIRDGLRGLEDIKR